MAILGVSVIILVTFGLVLLERYDRTAVILAGAVAAVLYGKLLGFYSEAAALQAISLRTLFLLIFIWVVSEVMRLAGVFDWLALHLLDLVGASVRRLFIGLTVLTYFVSLWVNNLTCIFVMATITTVLLNRLKIPLAKEFVISEVVASNLGGASTMIGDFPNMLISSHTGISFLAFWPMALVCFLLLLLQIGFISWQLRHKLAPPADFTRQLAMNIQVISVTRDKDSAITHRIGAVVGVGIALLSILAFAASGPLGLDPALIALCAAAGVLLFSQVAPKEVFAGVPIEYPVTFIGLFMLVGAVEASGALNQLAAWTVQAAGGNSLVIAIALMWLSAPPTALLDAGPSTAGLTPMIGDLVALAQTGAISPLPPNALWWALSLGVLAGSSWTVIGATAGLVAMQIVNRAVPNPGRLGMPAGPPARFPSRAWVRAELDRPDLTPRNFLLLATPITLLFLLGSSLFLVGYYALYGLLRWP